MSPRSGSKYLSQRKELSVWGSRTWFSSQPSLVRLPQARGCVRNRRTPSVHRAYALSPSACRVLDALIPAYSSHTGGLRQTEGRSDVPSEPLTSQQSNWRKYARRQPKNAIGTLVPYEFVSFWASKWSQLFASIYLSFYIMISAPHPNVLFNHSHSLHKLECTI